MPSLLLASAVPGYVITGVASLLVGMQLTHWFWNSHRRARRLLEEECEDLEARLQDMAQQLAQQRQGDEQAAAEVETLREEVVRLEQARQAAEQESQRRQGNLEEAEQSALEAEQRLEESLHRIQALERKLAERPLAAAAEDAAAGGSELAESRQLALRQAEELEAARASLDALSRRFCDAEEQNNQLQDALRRQAEEVSGVRELLRQAEEAREQLAGDCARLHEEVQDRGRSLDEERRQRAEDAAAWEQERRQTVHRQTEWCGELIRLRTTAGRRRRRLRRLERLQSVMGGRIGSLRRQRRELQRRLGDLEERRSLEEARARGDLEFAQQRAAELQALLDASQAECRTLEATLREAADRMRHLTRDRDASRQMQREIEQHLAELQELSHAQRAQVAQTRSRVEALEQENHSLQRETQQAREEQQQQAAQVAALQQQLSAALASGGSASGEAAAFRQPLHREMQTAWEQQLRLERQRHEALASMLSRAEQEVQVLRTQLKMEREEWEQRFAEQDCRAQSRQTELETAREEARRQAREAEQAVEARRRDLEDARRQLQNQTRALEAAAAETERLRLEARQAQAQQDHAGGDWSERLGRLQQEVQVRSEAELEAARRLRLLRQQFEDQQERLDRMEAQRDQWKELAEQRQQALLESRRSLQDDKLLWNRQQDALADLQRRCDDLEQQLQRKTLELAMLQRQTPAADDPRQQAARTIAELQSALRAHQAVLEQLPAAMPRRQLSAENPPPRAEHYDPLVALLRAQRDAQLHRSQQGAETAASPAAASPVAEAALATPAPHRLPAYPAEITRRDPVLGVVYTQRPREADDLRQIHGVAKVLEGKLHSLGIFTYRQILEWSDEAIDLVSRKIAFKDRIRRDNWVDQARRLYQAKYGAKAA